MSMFFAGVATLIQTIGFGRVGANVRWNRRNMMVFGIGLSLGLGLQLEPEALQHLPATLKVLATSGILPAALIAITLNLILPQEAADEVPDRTTVGAVD